MLVDLNCVLYALLKECSLASLYRSKLTSCQIQTCVCRLVSCCRLTKKYFCRRWDRLRRNDLFCLRRHFASYALYLLLIHVFLGIKPRQVDLGHIGPWPFQRCHPRLCGQLLGKRLTKSESELFCIYLSIDIVYSFRRIL